MASPDRENNEMTQSRMSSGLRNSIELKKEKTYPFSKKYFPQSLDRMPDHMLPQLLEAVRQHPSNCMAKGYIYTLYLLLKISPLDSLLTWHMLSLSDWPKTPRGPCKPRTIAGHAPPAAGRQWRRSPIYQSARIGHELCPCSHLRITLASVGLSRQNIAVRHAGSKEGIADVGQRRRPRACLTLDDEVYITYDMHTMWNRL